MKGEKVKLHDGVYMEIDGRGIRVTLDASESERTISIGPDALRAWQEHNDTQAPDDAYKGATHYAYAFRLAQLKPLRGEAADLVECWKLLYARYASLSERYRQNVHAMRGLRLQPDELAAKYDAVDAGFDLLTPLMKELHADLKRFAEKHSRPQTVPEIQITL